MEGARLPPLHSPQPTFQPALSAEALTLPSLLGLHPPFPLARHDTDLRAPLQAAPLALLTPPGGAGRFPGSRRKGLKPPPRLSRFRGGPQVPAPGLREGGRPPRRHRPGWSGAGRAGPAEEPPARRRRDASCLSAAGHAAPSGLAAGSRPSRPVPPRFKSPPGDPPLPAQLPAAPLSGDDVASARRPHPGAPPRQGGAAAATALPPLPRPPRQGGGGSPHHPPSPRKLPGAGPLPGSAATPPLPPRQEHSESAPALPRRGGPGPGPGPRPPQHTDPRAPAPGPNGPLTCGPARRRLPPGRSCLARISPAAQPRASPHTPEPPGDGLRRGGCREL